MSARDIHIGRLMLDSLQLISLGQFESAIGNMVQKICDQTEGPVTIFPVKEREETRLPSSHGRLGHTLTNLERVNPARIRVCQSLESMRAERTKHIILVDDFVGTGTRVRTFWETWANNTFKSWLSFHWCQLWLVTYAAHTDGIENVLKRISYLSEPRILKEISISDRRAFWPEEVSKLCHQLGHRTSRPGVSNGFGNLMCPIVFQHGCL
jgi:hypothetical protein